MKDAWNYYLKNDNKGRGFVLVGHSQGSFILDRADPPGDRRQADSVADSCRRFWSGTTIGGAEGQGRRRLVPEDSALPLGDADRVRHHVRVVPIDRAAAGQHACSARPPTATMVAACTNPAALAGGSGELHAYLSKDGRTITGTTPPKPWVVARAADRDAVGERARPADGASARRTRTRPISRSPSTAIPPTRAPTTSSATSAAPRVLPRTGACTSST